MIRTEQQYEELNRIKPLHFSPLHLVARAVEVPSIWPRRLLRCRASVERSYVQRCGRQVVTPELQRSRAAAR